MTDAEFINKYQMTKETFESVLNERAENAEIDIWNLKIDEFKRRTL